MQRLLLEEVYYSSSSEEENETTPLINNNPTPQSQQVDSPSLNSVPNEIILLIASFLEFNDLGRLTLVNKKMKQLLTDSASLTTYALHPIDDDNQLKIMGSYGKVRAHLIKINEIRDEIDALEAVDPSKRANQIEKCATYLEVASILGICNAEGVWAYFLSSQLGCTGCGCAVCVCANGGMMAMSGGLTACGFEGFTFWLTNKVEKQDKKNQHQQIKKLKEEIKKSITSEENADVRLTIIPSMNK